MSEENASVSQNEASPEVEKDAVTESLYDSFGIAPNVEKKEIEFPDLTKQMGNLEDSDEDPAIDQEDDEPKPEGTKKTLKAKYNGEELDVPEDEAREWIEKGMHLDKVRSQKTELEKNLDRAAKLAGYKDHAEYVADFDNIEKQLQQKEKNEHDQLLIDLREQAEDAGLDPDKVEAFLKNHPLVKEAEKLKQERDSDNASRRVQDEQQENVAKWQSMYSDPRVLAAFPSIAEDSKAFERNEIPEFFTAEMQSRINRGYDPLDAILLTHADKFQGQSKKAAEQKVIKQQQLGNRSQVQGDAIEPSNEPSLMPQHASLAAEFGVDLKGVRQQQKLITSRR